MSLLKNKHLLTAAIVTPVLALLGYFAVDHMTAEEPHAAVKGESYRLAEKPNCRYDSGRCGLKNGDFELDLVIDRLPDKKPVLKLSSAFPLDGVMVAVQESDADEKPPREMTLADEERMSWSLELEGFDPGTDRLHLAALASESVYFGDVSLMFASQGN